jgi:hypothetical protein
MHRAEEALAALQKAHKLMPAGCEDTHDQALALIELGRGRETRRSLELCVDDPKVGGLARGLLGRLPP